MMDKMGDDITLYVLWLTHEENHNRSIGATYFIISGTLSSERNVTFANKSDAEQVTWAEGAFLDTPTVRTEKQSLDKGWPSAACTEACEKRSLASGH